MKHDDLRNQFIARRDESDDFCHIIWLPSSRFDGCLPGPMTDILGAYLDRESGDLSFLISDPDSGDRDQDMVSFGSLPFSVQKDMIDLLKNN